MGRAAYQRLFSCSQAAEAESSYLKRAYTFPMRSCREREMLAMGGGSYRMEEGLGGKR